MASSIRSISILCLVFLSVHGSLADSAVCPRSGRDFFVTGIRSQCPLWIEWYSPEQVSGDELDRNLGHAPGNAYYSIFFYASWCPFSRKAQPVFDALSSMFPQIRHLAVEESSAMPSVFSRYGIHSFPSIMIANGTARMQYHGPKDLNSLVNFYKRTTGFDPVAYFSVEETPNSGSRMAFNLRDRSLKEIIRSEPYLSFSLAFICMKAFVCFFPVFVSRIKVYSLSLKSRRAFRSLLAEAEEEEEEEEEEEAMEAFYYLVFGALSVVVAVLELSKTSKDRISTSSAFTSFKNNYLVVYSLMMAGDWLQGPYVYYLYSQYGFDKGDIGRLFIAGFGSSMLFGTIVGSLADKQGRKRACVTYCITYILSCITKHSPQYKVLMLGRILGGIATSLLFSAFESWLVAEHNKRGFEPQWLSLTFSKAIFLGNGLIAIIAGLFANLMADNLGFGPVAPFDAAACFLAIGMAIILSTWTENYGDPTDSKDLITQFKVAALAIASDEKIALLGAIQSLFEGSMYTFVFLWTPALSPNDEDIPHGFIFATFMLSSMLGSSIASRLMARPTLKVESYMQIVFVISSFTLLLPILTMFLVTSPSVKGGSISFAGCIQLFGFCTFEACVGIFWPSIMKMRSQYIPEEARSTIMNFFRIPLNIFVCVVLYNVNAFPITIMFGMCSIFLLMASILQRRLMVVAEIYRSKSQDRTSMKERDPEQEPLSM